MLLRFTILLFLLLILGVDSTSFAQQSPFQVADQQFKDSTGQLDYVAPLRRLLASKQQFDSSMYAQVVATYASFVSHVSPQTLTDQQPLPVSYRLAELGPLLVERAQKTSVVILNEAHHQPAHRAYCAQLLPHLAALGYTQLAVEALDPADTLLNQRGYPLSTSGYYTCEPTFGRLLRSAHQAGFWLVAHEMKESQEREFADWKKRSNYRDSLHAVHILTALRAHPQAKLVAYVGYDHLLEKERDGLKRLATYLRELGQIDALTIDQTQQEYYPATPLNGPMLLTTDGHTPAAVGYNTGYVDVQVLHPLVKIEQQRPTWLFQNASEQLRLVRVPRAYRNQRYLVQLYDRAEYKAYGRKAIPLDQCLVAPGQRQVRLQKGTAKGTVLRYQIAELDAL